MSEGGTLSWTTVLAILATTILGVCCVSLTCWWVLLGSWLRSWPHKPLETQRPKVNGETQASANATPFVSLPLNAVGEEERV